MSQPLFQCLKQKLGFIHMWGCHTAHLVVQFSSENKKKKKSQRVKRPALLLPLKAVLFQLGQNVLFFFVPIPTSYISTLLKMEQAPLSWKVKHSYLNKGAFSVKTVQSCTAAQQHVGARASQSKAGQVVVMQTKTKKTNSRRSFTKVESWSFFPLEIYSMRINEAKQYIIDYIKLISTAV